MNRRGFLAGLGLTGAAIAFKPALPGTWLFPRDVVPYAGPITSEWIAAQSLAILTREVKLPRLETLTPAALYGLPWTEQYRWRQFGVDVCFEEGDMNLSRFDFSQRFIEPCMTLLANELGDFKPKYSFGLPNAKGADISHKIQDEFSGLNLRYIKMFDPMAHEPYMFSRFDIAVA